MKVIKNAFNLNKKENLSVNLMDFYKYIPFTILTIPKGQYCAFIADDEDFVNCIENRIPIFTLCHEDFLENPTNKVEILRVPFEHGLSIQINNKKVKEFDYIDNKEFFYTFYIYYSDVLVCYKIEVYKEDNIERYFDEYENNRKRF